MYEMYMYIVHVQCVMYMYTCMFMYILYMYRLDTVFEVSKCNRLL